MSSQYFTNPLFMPHAGDFWVSRYGKMYYAMYTIGTEVTIRGADCLEDLPHSEVHHIFRQVPDTDYAAHLWAPELHRLDGTWYIYFTACDGNIANHRMFALKNNNAIPLSEEWKLCPMLTMAEDGFAIDGTVFTHEGKYYMVYSHGRKLVIRPMTTPEKLSDERAVIHAPRDDEYGAAEGAVQLQTPGHSLLVYSQGDTERDDYCLKYLELIGDNPMDPACWKDSVTPFMTQSSTEFGPGHCGFFTDATGKIFISMHVILEKGGGAARRAGWVQELQLDSNGLPVPQHPVQRGTLLPEPEQK